MATTPTKTFTDYLSLRYKIVLIPEEDGWGAMTPDLPGCVGAGDTIAEALEMLDDAIQGWMSARWESNLPIPESSAHA